MDYDAFSILSVDGESRVLRHLFSIRIDSGWTSTTCDGKGITGARRNRERWCAYTTPQGPAVHRFAPGHTLGMAVPLLLQDRIIGCWTWRATGGLFTDDHVRTLALLAPQVASSVENARLYHEWPRASGRWSRPPGRARAAAHPAAGRHAGDRGAGGQRAAAAGAGNFGRHLRLYEYQDGPTLIAFGDVSGKGAAAALYGGLVSGLLRTMAPRRRVPRIC